MRQSAKKKQKCYYLSGKVHICMLNVKRFARVPNLKIINVLSLKHRVATRAPMRVKTPKYSTLFKTVQKLRVWDIDKKYSYV